MVPGQHIDWFFLFQWLHVPGSLVNFVTSVTQRPTIIWTLIVAVAVIGRSFGLLILAADHYSIRHRWSVLYYCVERLWCRRATSDAKLWTFLTTWGTKILRLLRTPTTRADTSGFLLPTWRGYWKLIDLSMYVWSHLNAARIQCICCLMHESFCSSEFHITFEHEIQLFNKEAHTFIYLNWHIFYLQRVWLQECRTRSDEMLQFYWFWSAQLQISLSQKIEFEWKVRRFEIVKIWAQWSTISFPVEKCGQNFTEQTYVRSHNQRCRSYNFRKKLFFQKKPRRIGMMIVQTSWPMNLFSGLKVVKDSHRKNICEVASPTATEVFISDFVQH